MKLTTVTPLEELKEIFVEQVIDRTDKITKVADASALSGTAYGVAKIAQKTLKDIALLETQIFPTLAFGIYLDRAAASWNGMTRFTATGSSTYVRIFATAGTFYSATVVTFTGSDGITFRLDADFTTPVDGYGYAKVSSTTLGKVTNVPAYKINTCAGAPSGHKYVINEYRAEGGRDIESDEDFRNRIVQGTNILARGTLSYLEQVFMKTNPDILRVFHNGFNANGQIVIGVLKQSGADLIQSEIDALLVNADEYLNLTEYRTQGFSASSIVLANIVWYPIDVSVRVDLMTNVDAELVRSEIQTAFSKYVDYRGWKTTRKVEWDDLLQLVKETPGVRYVYDAYFYLTIPNGLTYHRDLSIPRNTLPRFQGFQLLDTNGLLITGPSVDLNTYYYPNKPDLSYQREVLKTL